MLSYRNNIYTIYRLRCTLIICFNLHKIIIQLNIDLKYFYASDFKQPVSHLLTHAMPQNDRCNWIFAQDTA